MTQTLIEEVAKAIFESYPATKKWDELKANGESKVYYLKAAKAAIAAIFDGELDKEGLERAVSALVGNESHVLRRVTCGAIIRAYLKALKEQSYPPVKT